MVRGRIARLEFAIWIVDIMGKVTHHVHILLIAFCAQALIAFGAILVAQGVGVKRLRPCIICHGRFLLMFPRPDLFARLNPVYRNRVA